MKSNCNLVANSINILLIEDNPGDARLMIDVMKQDRSNNTIYHVCSCSEALLFLKQQGSYIDVERPDLIILDLNMPIMDGREFLVTIKDNHNLSTIPLVVLSNSSSESDIQQSYGNHANCFITKPLNFDDFVDVIKSIEHFWSCVAERPVSL